MKATTIKLDGDLLVEIERSKPSGMSVTSYVRETLQKSLVATRLREAAAEYKAMTEADPEERALLKEWDEADLVSAPKLSKRQTRTSA